MDINFLCRPSKASKKTGKAPIEMSLIVNGERTYIRLQMKAEPEDFKKSQASKKNNVIKNYCKTCETRVRELEDDMMKRGIPLTAATLKECFTRGGVLKVYTLNELFSSFLAIAEDRVGVDLSKDTYNRYVKARDFFYQFNADIKPETPAANVSLEHLKKVQVGLGKILDAATSCNYLQKLKAMFKAAFENGHIPSNPGFGLKINKGQKDDVLYLLPEELDRIKTHEFGCDRLQEVADVFVFACYTGLSYCDLRSLTKADFKFSDEGIAYIDKKRGKTGTRYFAAVLKEADTIAKKYQYELPVKSDQKYNAYLKEIAAICNIVDENGKVKKLTTHMARHTCCCFLLNHRDPVIPTETILRVMGWKSEKQMRHYASIMSKTILDDMAKIESPKDRAKRQMLAFLDGKLKEDEVDWTILTGKPE